MQVFDTERLILRRFSPADDAQFILELLNEPPFIQNIGDRHVRTLSDAKRYIETGPVASYALNGFGLYVVKLKESGETIGMCGLIKREALEDVDVGYAFLTRYWSHGYAIEALTGTMQYAKHTVELKRIVAIVDPKNERSIRTLEKAGFKYEKLIRLSKDDIDLKLFVIEV